MLSQAAFNAFLKTLEEPPHHAIFILATTEKHKILPTILSRCQIYDFNRIGIKDTIDHLQYVAKLEHINAEPEALTVIAQKADGGMRDALSIFDQVVSFTGGNITYKSVIENLNVLDYEYYFKLTDLLLENKVPESMLLFNDVLKKGFDGSHFITGLSSHFRDLLVSKDPSTLQLLEVGAGIRDRYKEQAQKCDQKFLYRAMKLCNDCDLNYRASKNKRLLVELTLIQCAQLTLPDADDASCETISWNGEQGFGYASSKDLIHWSEQREIKVMKDSLTNNVWAPEVFYDDEKEQFIVAWSSAIPVERYTAADSLGANKSHRAYYTTTKDFQTFTPAKAFYDPGFNSIDGFIVKRDKNDYVLIIKDNRKPGYSDLFCVSGPSAEGPYADPSVKFAPTYSEGPCAVKVGDEWLIYFDVYREGRFGAVSTKDFKNFTPIDDQISIPQGHKHGTIIEVPESVLLNLKAEEAKRFPQKD